MNDNDFFSRTTEVLNSFVDSIEKGVENLKKDIQENAKTNPMPRPFGKDLFIKPEMKREKAAPASGKPAEFPFNRIDTFDTVKIICDLPGCDKSALKLDYEKDTLVVRAKREEPDFGDAKITFRESSKMYYGEMEKRFRVGKVDVSSIHASYKEGVLMITCKRVYNDGGVGITIE